MCIPFVVSVCRPASQKRKTISFFLHSTPRHATPPISFLSRIFLPPFSFVTLGCVVVVAAAGGGIFSSLALQRDDEGDKEEDRGAEGGDDENMSPAASMEKRG